MSILFYQGVNLNLYGSYFSGFGLKGASDVNIELTAEKAPQSLMQLYKVLKAANSGTYICEM